MSKRNVLVDTPTEIGVNLIEFICSEVCNTPMENIWLRENSINYLGNPSHLMNPIEKIQNDIPIIKENYYGEMKYPNYEWCLQRNGNPIWNVLERQTD